MSYVDPELIKRYEEMILKLQRDAAPMVRINVRDVARFVRQAEQFAALIAPDVARFIEQTERFAALTAPNVARLAEQTEQFSRLIAPTIARLVEQAEQLRTVVAPALELRNSAAHDLGMALQAVDMPEMSALFAGLTDVGVAEVAQEELAKLREPVVEPATREADLGTLELLQDEMVRQLVKAINNIAAEMRDSVASQPYATIIILVLLAARITGDWNEAVWRVFDILVVWVLLSARGEDSHPPSG